MDARTFISGAVGSYYKSASGIAPDHTPNREFGFGTFDRKIAERHLSFKSEEDLLAYMARTAPMHVSYSTAYYEKPSATPMEAKGWQGSELVFDIDVTDMDLPCQKVHGKDWVCENCFVNVKAEAIKLIEEFLVPDFGFSESEIEVNFSGNRGYHIHVKNEAVKSLDANARRQIGNYIAGIGLSYNELFPTAGQKGKMLMGPKPTDYGWRGKFARNFIRALEGGKDSLIALGVDHQIATRLYNKRLLVEMGIKNGNWDMVYIKNKNDFWAGILSAQAIVQSDRIDKNVTADPSHLIRLPNSIHGETGLIAKKVGSKSNLEKFEPMKDAIAIRGHEISVHVPKAEGFAMGGESFGPYENADVTLPAYAAVYLYLKGKAEITKIQ